MIQVLVRRQPVPSVIWRKASEPGTGSTREVTPVRERLDVARVVVDRLALEKPLAVADRELEPAERRRAEVGVVDLAQRALPQREPRLAVELLGGAEAVLVTCSTSAGSSARSSAC